MCWLQLRGEVCCESVEAHLSEREWSSLLKLWCLLHSSEKVWLLRSWVDHQPLILVALALLILQYRPNYTLKIMLTCCVCNVFKCAEAVNKVYSSSFHIFWLRKYYLKAWNELLTFDRELSMGCEQFNTHKMHLKSIETTKEEPKTEKMQIVVLLLLLLLELH